MNDPTEIVNYEMRGGPDSGSFAYWTRYNNPDLNAKITAADLEQDPARREAEYVDIQRTYLHDAPLVQYQHDGVRYINRDVIASSLSQSKIGSVSDMYLARCRAWESHVRSASRFADYSRNAYASGSTWLGW